MGRRRQPRDRTLWPCPDCGSLMWLSRTAGKRAVDNLGCDACGHYEKLETIAERQMGQLMAGHAERRVRDGPGADAEGVASDAAGIGVHGEGHNGS